MSRERPKAISQDVVWIFEECFPAFNGWRNADHNAEQNTSSSLDSTSIKSEITELKSQVSTIIDTLRQMSSQNSASVTTNFLHSTPNTSYELMNGSHIINTGGTERHQVEQCTTCTMDEKPTEHEVRKTSVHLHH